MLSRLGCPLLLYFQTQKILTPTPPQKKTKKATVKYITLLSVLQEMRELLSPGLPATSITKKMLSAKKNPNQTKKNKKNLYFFPSGIQCRMENCTVAIFFCLLAFQSVWDAPSWILCLRLLWNEHSEQWAGSVPLGAVSREVIEPRLHTFPGETGRVSVKFLWPLTSLQLWATCGEKKRRDRKPVCETPSACVCVKR